MTFRIKYSIRVQTADGTRASTGQNVSEVPPDEPETPGRRRPPGEGREGWMEAIEQIVIQAWRSLLEGCHHVPSKAASSSSSAGTRWDTAETPASILPSARPPRLPPKVKRVFPGNANRSSCVPSSKTTADGEHVGRLGRVRVSTVARPSGGTPVAGWPGRPVKLLSYLNE